MIAEVLYSHLMDQERLLDRFLARYYGKLAIFNQEAPEDTDPGWLDEEYPEYPEDPEEEPEKKSQYGRIVYALDWSDDPERKYNGTLMVDVYCEKGVQLPEELEPIIRPLIDGYFFSTKDITIAAQWSASNYFTEPTDEVIGVTLTFGLLAFPKQTTNEPDPIALFNRWTKKELQDITGKHIRVIGHDDLDSVWKPTAEMPAIYWRQASISPCGWIPDTYSCSWLTSVIYGHIITPDKSVNASITRMIENILTMKRRLIFEDQAPLMVDRNIRVNLASDLFRVGQITIDATFGLLRIPMKQPVINNIDIQERRSEDE